jgi:hypothetical protein
VFVGWRRLLRRHIPELKPKADPAPASSAIILCLDRNL